MKAFALLIISFLNFAHAETFSVLLPRVLEAIGEEGNKSYVGRPDLNLIRDLIVRHEISRRSLERWQKLDPKKFSLELLPKPEASKSGATYPPLALHAHSFLVAEESDDVTNDDIYLSFFITDGWVPMGRVTSVYRGLDEGESFLFLLEDRILFPVHGGLEIPRGALIVDYMIIESDGDDITEMKRISGFITDLAIEFYRRKYGDSEISHLREEVRLLSNALLDLDHDDHLVTSTWSPGPEEILRLFGEERVGHITRTHKESSPWGDFKYKLTLRLMR